MEVIMLKDVENIGKEGDVVKVKDGYARNFLIPKGLADLATKQTMNILEQRKKKKRLEEERLKAQAAELAGKITALSCTIPVEAGVEDKIFGTVTSEMIRNVLRNEGIEVDKKNIVIDEPINKLGVYQIKIKMHPEVTADLRIWVVKK
ncbi:MAG: 50S ribosomal protein L9 [Candidatus Omnitrophota bacterium]